MPHRADPTPTIIVAHTHEQGRHMRRAYGTEATSVYSGATIRMATHGMDLSGHRVVVAASLWHEPGMPQLLRERNCREVLVML